MGILQRMKGLFKTSRYTVYLLICAIIVIIINQFYDPLNRGNIFELYYAKDPFTDIYRIEFIDGKKDFENSYIVPEEELLEELYQNHPVGLYMFLLEVFFPVFSSMGELCTYLYFLFSESDSAFFLTFLLILCYVFISYLIEKIHSKLHEEKPLAMCVDLWCVEIIVMFFFDLAFSLIIKLIEKTNIPIEIWMILAMLISIFTFFAFLFIVSYLSIGLFVSLFVPMLLGELIGNINDTLGIITFFILSLVFSRIVWKLFSDRVYNHMIKLYSFGILSLDN